MFVARVARQTKTREYKDLDAHFTANLGYSHHQKAVIVDAPREISIRSKPEQHENNGKVNGKRRIIAYVGGIDLTGNHVPFRFSDPMSNEKVNCLSDGRYDTPEHSLFQSLVNEHRDDFYQPCEPGIKACYGPRMPWQDIHARVEGPAARDIMTNFVERFGKEQPLNSRLLIQNVETSGQYDIHFQEEDKNDGNSWGVQVFRSITSDSAR